MQHICFKVPKFLTSLTLLLSQMQNFADPTRLPKQVFNHFGFSSSNLRRESNENPGHKWAYHITILSFIFLIKYQSLTSQTITQHSLGFNIFPLPRPVLCLLPYSRFTNEIPEGFLRRFLPFLKLPRCPFQTSKLCLTFKALYRL